MDSKQNGYFGLLNCKTTKTTPYLFAILAIFSGPQMRVVTFPSMWPLEYTQLSESSTMKNPDLIHDHLAHSPRHEPELHEDKKGSFSRDNPFTQSVLLPEFTIVYPFSLVGFPWSRILFWCLYSQSFGYKVHLEDQIEDVKRSCKKWGEFMSQWSWTTLVGGIPTPLKNISLSIGMIMDDYSQYMEK